MTTLQQQRSEAAGRVVECDTGPGALLTHEYPGFLILHGAHERGDVGFDFFSGATPPAWASRALAVLVYDGSYHDDSEAALDARGYGTIPIDHELDDGAELGESFAEITGDGDVLMHFPGGVQSLVTGDHVFTYGAGSYGDGGDCRSIIHRVDPDGTECDALDCPRFTERGDVDHIIDDVDAYALADAR